MTRAVLEYLAKVRKRPVLAYRTISNVNRWLYRKTVLRTYKVVRKSVLAFMPFELPSQPALAHAGDCPDYIVWGVIDWHFRHQRPQQIAQQLARSGRRVFYISSNFRDDARAGFEVEPLDETGRLFQIKLFVQKPPVIYFSEPSAEAIRQLRQSIGEVLRWAQSRQIISFVQHSFWYDIARAVPNARLVYDCIDHHEGFGNNSNGILSLEQQLLKNAELTVTTSDWLDAHVAKFCHRRVLIRNACEYEHFSSRPTSIYTEPLGRRIIGYYGAIANWFDLELIAYIAASFPDCCILLVGADTVGAQLHLANFKNVVFVGEVPYTKLPYYLYAFDVAILPFKVIPLTLATNPVKVYEYLAAGKPVVSVDLPELAAFEGHALIAHSKQEFAASISKIFSQAGSAAPVEERQAFARQQTWQHRTDVLIHAAEHAEADPLVSVVVVTYNNLQFTQACLQSIEQLSDYANMEVIVVDNNSTDGSVEFLARWQGNDHKRKLILNDTNRGFAAANNQGLSAASGEYLVMLNNDTYVTPGWVRTLVRHLKYSPHIGIIGPVTNNIGNEAKIKIHYQDMSEMLFQAKKYTHFHLGELLPLRTLAFFCVMLPRYVFEKVGLLDESFGLGFFEDDDYCRRIESAGFQIVCAEDVFIHHHLSASFMKMRSKERKELFETNKAYYEAKWGKWIPHQSRALQ